MKRQRGQDQPLLGTGSWPHENRCAGIATGLRGLGSPPSLALGPSQQDQGKRQHDREQDGKRDLIRESARQVMQS